MDSLIASLPLPPLLSLCDLYFEFEINWMDIHLQRQLTTTIVDLENHRGLARKNEIEYTSLPPPPPPPSKLRLFICLPYSVQREAESTHLFSSLKLVWRISLVGGKVSSVPTVLLTPSKSSRPLFPMSYVTQIRK